jgi:energy-coupling factor transport system ATP-binding protein
MKKGSVVLSDITFHYEQRSDMQQPALKINRLCFEQGKCYLITGACGSGKTTLALLLKGLINPASGSVVIQGDQKELGAFQRDIGFLFQYPEEQFFKETVAEEIGFGPRLRGLADIEQRIEKSLRTVGLSGMLFTSLPLSSHPASREGWRSLP